MRFDTDNEGRYIELESADPLLTDFDHRRVFRREEVPPKTIWMVALYTERDAEPQKSQPDPKPPAGGRWWRLFVWPRWFFVPSLTVACYLTLPWLPAALTGNEIWVLGSIVTAAWSIMALQATLIAGIDIGLAGLHLYTKYCIERDWGPGWTAGTTGCVEDGRQMRNGLLP